MFFFQLPGIPERSMMRNDFEMLRKTFEVDGFGADEIEPYVEGYVDITAGSFQAAQWYAPDYSGLGASASPCATSSGASTRSRSLDATASPSAPAWNCAARFLSGR